jgi:hypothetical protein
MTVREHAAAIACAVTLARKPHPLNWMVLALRALGYDAEVEHRFHPTRKWRLDLAVPSRKVALEIEGVGGLRGHEGRHRSIGGFIRDREKYSEAAILGWRIVFCTPREARDSKGAGMDRLLRALESAAAE